MLATPTTIMVVCSSFFTSSRSFDRESSTWQNIEKNSKRGKSGLALVPIQKGSYFFLMGARRRRRRNNDRKSPLLCRRGMGPSSFALSLILCSILAIEGPVEVRAWHLDALSGTTPGTRSPSPINNKFSHPKDPSRCRCRREGTLQLPRPGRRHIVQLCSNVRPVADGDSQGGESSWTADDYDNDYDTLKAALARHNARTNLKQQQRKHMLDSFARNRRPLIPNALRSSLGIGLWTAMLFTGGAALDRCWTQPLSIWKRCLAYSTSAAALCSSIHYWTICMITPLCLLLSIKLRKIGPTGLNLDEYFRTKSHSDLPKFFYTSEHSLRRAKAKDTSDFALCLLENWCSAVALSFLCGLITGVASFRIESKRAHAVAASTRLITRLGAAASLFQYPSLVFELNRGDQPMPLCRSTAYMRLAVSQLLGGLSFGIAYDLAELLRFGPISSMRQAGLLSRVGLVLSAFAPICNVISLARIVRISKCSAVSLSEYTSFPADETGYTDMNSTKQDATKRMWRYQLRWRSPQRIVETLKSWSKYFLTGHVPLLAELDRSSSHLQSNVEVPEEYASEMVSLIFRNRTAGLLNATEAKYEKHQVSYDTKSYDDVLGVAVQRSLGVGVSYDFDHFDSPPPGQDVPIHQLRARMAKSAIRRKRELDKAMGSELNVLRKLKNNVVTENNAQEAEVEMSRVKQHIKSRHNEQVDQMKDALLTMIPLDAEAPKGSQGYESPMMIAEYVNLTASFQQRGQYKESIGEAPDLEEVQSYVRREYGEEAAEAFSLGKDSL